MIDWRAVDLDGATVAGLSNVCHHGRGIHVWGGRGGHPYAAAVSSARRVTEVVPRWPGRVAGVLQDDAGTLRVTGGSPPRTHPGEDDDEWAAVDEADPFVGGWVVMGDEDPCNLALSASGRLYAYEYGGETPQAGPRLLPGHAGEDLVVTGRDIGVVVAGHLAPGDADLGTDRSAPSAWAYANEQWAELDVVDPPHAWTDAYTRWEPVLAGHRNGRPRLYAHVGTPLPAARVDLDPARPRVCVAHVDGPPFGSHQPDWQGRLVLAVQAAAGVQLWFQRPGGWTMVPGPRGTLQSARLGYNEKEWAWVVTDGRLWSGDLAAVWDAVG